MIEETVNALIQETKLDTNSISDGYHTFAELYEHRIILFLALCRAYRQEAWKAKKHSDGTEMFGWFVAGLHYLPGEQITYHLPLDYWEQMNVQEYESAPPFDGHTSADVLERLRKI